VQDEESLVLRAQQHDQAAFAELYEEHFDKIYRYVTFKIGNETEAEDVTQQVFLNSLQSISSFKWKGVSFSAWLFRIAHNQIIDFWRKKKHTTVELNETIVSEEGDPARTAEDKLELERLTRAAGKLTKAQQEVISLRFTSDLPIAEVARIMGKSEGAIKALQHSAIIALRKVLAVT
jgi:RNA polymerase sigma-70 factor (ECF subfamily)